jgi:Flp pilus assembly protein CpaB
VGVSSRRTLILIAAVVIGAMAAYALWSYTGGIEDRANDNARRVKVFVVEKDIARGMRGEEAKNGGFISEKEIPAEFYPVNAIQSDAAIDGLVAVSNLAANQVVVDGMFVEPRLGQTQNSQRIPFPTQVAITVSVDQVRGVANLLVPGDFVNILVLPDTGGHGPCDETTDSTDPSAQPTAPEGTTAVYCTPARYLYQKVQILFVDKLPIPLPGEQTQTTTEDGEATVPQQINAGLITFAVPPDAAQRIASVGADQIYLTLVPKDYVPTALPPLDPFVQLLPGEDALQLTPYGPSGQQEP